MPTSNEPMAHWLSIPKAADALGVHHQTLRKWCNEGREPATLFAVRWGRNGWRIHRPRLEQFMAGELIAVADSAG